MAAKSASTPLNRLSVSISTHFSTQPDRENSHQIRAVPPSIFTQGDPATDVFYLQQGSVKLSVLSRTGKEAVVAILGPGDFFGEGCLRGSRGAWRPPRR